MSSEYCTPSLTAEHSRAAKWGDRLKALDWFWKLPRTWKSIQAEYIWIDAEHNLRCKTRTLPAPVVEFQQIPVWNFDGSSTGQAPGTNSEIMLNPVRFANDPFRGGLNILVLCECLHPDGTPAKGNNRYNSDLIFENKEVKDSHIWFGFEQEYTMFQPDGQTPLGWPHGSCPPPQGPYYCGIGADRAFGRDIAEAHYRACLHAGLDISGINAEVMPGQWEFQVGPCEGVDAGDQLVLARYILGRVCEMFGVIVSFYPKPIKGDWNGAGLHTNTSTAAMRNEGGYEKILEAMELLKDRHAAHIKVYGIGNEERLTGKHETSSMTDFSYGVADRGASIRIPRQVFLDQKGYFEDRRPASSACPYQVSAEISRTVHKL